MAFVKVRGAQVKPSALKNEHVAADAAIAESKLNIDWATHYSNALATKFMLDYVQKNGVNVTGASLDNAVDAAYPHANDDAEELGVIVSDNLAKGRNKVILRDTTTGEPVLDGLGQEVYGRLTWDETLNSNNGGYKLSFFSGADVAYTFAAAATVDIQYVRRFTLRDVDEGFAMNEKYVDGAADVTAHLNIEQLAADLYASPEVDRDGQANLTTPLETQISDEATRATTAEGELQTAINNEASARAQAVTDEATARSNADQAIRDDLASNLNAKGASLVGIEDANNKLAATNIEAALEELYDKTETDVSNEATARANADQAIRDDLADTTNAKGASLIGIEDAGDVFAATTVEGALDEIEGRVNTLETTGNQEIIDTHTRDANSANGYFTLQTFDYLEDRLVNIETLADAKAKVADDNATALAAEVTARTNADKAIRDDLASVNSGKGASLVGVEDAAGNFTASTTEGVLAELADALASEASARTSADTALGNRVTALEANDHVHGREVKKIDALGAGLTTVSIASTVPVGAVLDVYVNGVLQAPVHNYTENDDGTNITSVDFQPDTLVLDDIVIFKWTVNV